MRNVALLTVSLFVAGQFAGCEPGPVDYDLYESTPSLQLDVQINAQTATQLETLLSEFATTNNYELYIGRVHPDDPEFNIILFRKDSMIIGTNPFDFSEYKFGIYPARLEPPDENIVKSTLNDLGSELVTK